MKLSDILKRFGIDLDTEIDDTEEKTSGVNNEEIKKDVKVENVTKEVTKESVKTEEDKKVKLNYDSKTGLFDLSNIEDAELKAVLKEANNNVKAKDNKILVDKAVTDKMATVKLAKGITADFVVKALDLSNVKVTDGAVTGLDEAFNSLMTSQSGLFVADKETKESNPMLEGFNPMNSAQQGVAPNSFMEAFSMME